MPRDGWPWKPRPDYTRLLRAIRRQGDPANVPFLELFADQEVIGAFLGEKASSRSRRWSNREALEVSLDQRIRFWHQLGYDAVWQGITRIESREARIPLEDTAELKKDSREWINESVGPVSTWEDFDRHAWPSASDADYYPLEYVAANLPEGMAVVASLRGTLEFVMELMGYETFAVSLYDNPDLVQAMFDKYREIYLPVARSLVQMERVEALWMADDMGFKTGTMVSPMHLRQHVFPIQKEMADIAHDQGVPFLLHSCGNLEAVMDDLIDEVGVDGKHSFEDAIEPVEEFSARYGHRLSLIGGVDIDLLARGSEQQVRARTRQILEACAPSRGYILGTGNSVANYIPLRNFLAMLDEGQRFSSQAKG